MPTHFHFKPFLNIYLINIKSKDWIAEVQTVLYTPIVILVDLGVQRMVLMPAIPPIGLILA